MYVDVTYELDMPDRQNVSTNWIINQQTKCIMQTLKLCVLFVALCATSLLSSCEFEHPSPDSAYTMSESFLGKDAYDVYKCLRDYYDYDSADIEFHDDVFVVEGDLAYPAQDFWNLYGPIKVDGLAKHYVQNYLVSEDYDKVILNLWDPNLTPEWKQVFEQAVNYWNQTDSRLSFHVIYGSRKYYIPGVVNVNAVFNYNGGYYGQAYPPNRNGVPGTTININLAYESNYFSAPSTEYLRNLRRLRTAAHEIGHIVGFRHTDKYVGNLVRNVSSSCRYYEDCRSIMRTDGQSSASCSTPTFWTGFSDCDLEVIGTVYGE